MQILNLIHEKGPLSKEPAQKFSKLKKMEKKDFVGHYERTPIQNESHEVEMFLDGDQLMWKNGFDRTWKMDFDGEKLEKADDEADAEAQVV